MYVAMFCTFSSSYINFKSLVIKLGLVLWILNQFTDYNSCTTGASLMKLDVHQRHIVMNIFFKFHKCLP